MLLIDPLDNLDVGVEEAGSRQHALEDTHGQRHLSRLATRVHHLMLSWPSEQITELELGGPHLLELLGLNPSLDLAQELMQLKVALESLAAKPVPEPAEPAPALAAVAIDDTAVGAWIELGERLQTLDPGVLDALRSRCEPVEHLLDSQGLHGSQEPIFSSRPEQRSRGARRPRPPLRISLIELGP